MAGCEIILYLTQADAECLRKWLNDEDAIAWIVAAKRKGRTYTWKAVDRLDAIVPQEYCIWHKSTFVPTVPSGRPGVPDRRVRDPYAGWQQELTSTEATEPWFGANLPGPVTFAFRPRGRQTPEAIGRSGFSWLGDHFRQVGNPAKPEAKAWWRRLSRFVHSQAVAIPWPVPNGIGRYKAYAFPDAHRLILKGRQVEHNP